MNIKVTQTKHRLTYNIQNLFHNIRRSTVDNWGELANRFLLIVCKYSSIKIYVGRVDQIDSGRSWFERWGELAKRWGELEWGELTVGRVVWLSIVVYGDFTCFLH